jgi:hypothetical protein
MITFDLFDLIFDPEGSTIHAKMYAQLEGLDTEQTAVATAVHLGDTKTVAGCRRVAKK